MSKKDNRIAELEAQLVALNTTFLDLLAVCFAETNEHAKHHADEMADTNVTIEEIVAAEAHLIGHLEAGELSHQQVVETVAKWLGHYPLPSSMGDISFNVLEFPIKPGETIESTLKAQLENGDVPAEIREVLNAMFGAGIVDQLDAKARDLRNQGNAHLN